MSSGLLSFPVTHFGVDLQLDLDGYRDHVAWLASFDASALFAAGGTDEFFSLSPAEIAEVTRAAKDAFHVVVQKDPCRAPEHGERLDVAADEVGERGAEVEAHEGISGVAQHQDERHQRAFGASDGELSEVRPVDLSLLARKGAKAQIRFTGRRGRSCAMR